SPTRRSTNAGTTADASLPGRGGPPSGPAQTSVSTPIRTRSPTSTPSARRTAALIGTTNVLRCASGKTDVDQRCAPSVTSTLTEPKPAVGIGRSAISSLTSSGSAANTQLSV